MAGSSCTASTPTGYFLQRCSTRRLSAAAQLSGKVRRRRTLSIRLEPCGAGTARLRDSHGRPVAGYRDGYGYMISMSIIPDRDPGSRTPADASGLRGQVGRLFAIDPIKYAKEPVSDPQGHIRFPALIPGASYQIVDRTGVRGPSSSRVPEELHRQTR